MDDDLRDGELVDGQARVVRAATRVDLPGLRAVRVRCLRRIADAIVAGQQGQVGFVLALGRRLQFCADCTGWSGATTSMRPLIVGPSAMLVK